MRRNNRWIKFIFPWTLLACALMASAALSQESAVKPSRSEQTIPSEKNKPVATGTSEAASEDDFSFSLGGGVVVSPRPYPGADARVIPIPAIEIRYKRWFVQGIRGGYSFIQSGPFEANLLAQAQFKGLDSEDSPFLEGMASRSPSMDAGLEFVCSTRPLGFRASFITDTLGRSDGQELSLLALTGAPLFGRGFFLFGIGPRWLSQNRVDYYYGVRDSEVNPSRPAYKAPATWNLDINLTGIVELSARWRIVAIMNRSGFGDGIKKSPIIEQNAEYSFIGALSYTF